MYKAVVIGTSFGGPEALKKILSELQSDFALPVIVVLHIGEHTNEYFIRHLGEICKLCVKEAEAHEKILPGFVYFAPPDYHLQVEEDFTFSLSTDKKIHFSRPSIDVLFESAAWTYKNHLIGLVLTGANADGALGLKTIKSLGGKTIVQNPAGAASPRMPEHALQLSTPDFVIDLEEIAPCLNDLATPC